MRLFGVFLAALFLAIEPVGDDEGAQRAADDQPRGAQERGRTRFVDGRRHDRVADNRRKKADYAAERVGGVGRALCAEIGADEVAGESPTKRIISTKRSGASLIVRAIF